MLSNISLGVAGYNSVKTRLKSMQISQIVPKSNLLNKVFMIPPVLHVKKWLTLSIKNPYDVPYLTNLKITYKVDNKKTESVLFKLREGYTSSRLQGNYLKVMNDRERKKRKAQMNAP